MDSLVYIYDSEILNNPEYQSSETSIEVLRSALVPVGHGTFDVVKDDTTKVATLTINQPEHRNAFSGSMMAQFGDVLSELQRWHQVSRY